MNTKACALASILSALTLVVFLMGFGLGRTRATPSKEPAVQSVQPVTVPTDLVNELMRQVQVYRNESDMWRKTVDDHDTLWGKRCQELKEQAKAAELNAWKKVKAELEALPR